MREFDVVGVDWRSLLIPKIPLMDVVGRAVLVYIMLQVGMRQLGRRNMQNMSSYNMVTLFLVGAFGGRAVLGDDTSFTGCALGLTIILGLNWLVSWAAFHSPFIANLVEGPVTRQLIKDGELQPKTMRRVRCTEELLTARLRSRGQYDLQQVWEAHMERNGEITFVMREDIDDGDTASTDGSQQAGWRDHQPPANH